MKGATMGPEIQLFSRFFSKFKIPSKFSSSSPLFNLINKKIFYQNFILK